MSDLRRESEVTFLENSEGEAAVRSFVRSFAQGCAYVADRFIYHSHLYEAAESLPARRLIAEYLAHLGYMPSCAEGLRELTVARAYEILEDMFRYDLARHEEMVTETAASLLVERLREETAAWAVLAFTNLKFPEPPTAPLAYYGFLRAVARENVEGGVLLVGEQDIAMIWFLDDDGPARGIMDLSSPGGRARQNFGPQGGTRAAFPARGLNFRIVRTSSVQSPQPRETGGRPRRRPDASALGGTCRACR